MYLCGKHKLADKWEADIQIVIKYTGDLPVYTVKPESKEGLTHTLIDISCFHVVSFLWQ